MIGFPDSERTPDVLEPILGYRWVALVPRSRWNPLGKRSVSQEVESPYMHVPWTTDMRAACLVIPLRNQGVVGGPTRQHPEPSPVWDCKCGLYASFGLAWLGNTKRRDWLPPETQLARAIVSLRGRVIVHTEGMRAEYARLEAIETDRRLADHYRRVRVVDRLEDVDLEPIGRQLKDDSQYVEPANLGYINLHFRLTSSNRSISR